MGSKQPLRRFCGGKACLGLSLPQTPLMWEPPALGLPFFLYIYSFSPSAFFFSNYAGDRAARHFIKKEVNKYKRLGETPQSLHTNTPIKTEKV